MSLLIRTDRIWDLSQPIFHDGPAWAEYDPPNLTHNYRREAEGFNAETVTLNTHTGTHVDVPYHFDDGGPTSWGAKRAVSEEYLKRWPYLGGDGAQLLLDQGISAVGIDALSIGGWGGPEKGEPAHVALLGAGKVIIEELNIPDELAGRRGFFTAFPVLLEGCGGAWTRAVAWEITDSEQ